MKTKQIAVTLSAIVILNLSTPPKAAAFDLSSLGDIAGGIIGQLGDLGLISEGLAANFGFYTQLGQTLLKFIDTQSLDALVSILPDLLGQFGGLDGLAGGLAECGEGGADCASLIGVAGGVDWQQIDEIVREGVNAANEAADQTGRVRPGEIKPGAIDRRYRPLVTAQIRATKDATWSQLQEAEFEALSSKDGQKFVQEERQTIAKIIKDDIENVKKISKTDNTQDILKLQATTHTRGLALQQRSLENQYQIRRSIDEGNNTENRQLAIARERLWREEIERSYDQQGADSQGQAWSDFVNSISVDPGQDTGQ